MKRSIYYSYTHIKPHQRSISVHSVSLGLLQSIRSILVYSVHFGLFGPFDLFQSTSVLFCPFQSTSLLFGPLRAIWSIWSISVHFGPVWSISIHFSSILSNSVYLVQFSLFGPFQFKISHFDPISPIWFITVHFGHILSNSVHVGPFWTNWVLILFYRLLFQFWAQFLSFFFS